MAHLAAAQWCAGRPVNGRLTARLAVRGTTDVTALSMARQIPYRRLHETAKTEMIFENVHLSHKE